MRIKLIAAITALGFGVVVAVAVASSGTGTVSVCAGAHTVAIDGQNVSTIPQTCTTATYTIPTTTVTTPAVTTTQTVTESQTTPAPPAPTTAGYTGACDKTITAGTNPATSESSMTAGQVLCLNSGVYGAATNKQPFNYNAAGTAAKPIIVTSSPGQTATIVGADYINGAYITFEHLNLDQDDVLYNANGGSNPAPCAFPVSEGMIINGSGDQLLDNNVYESTVARRGVLIGINYGSSTAITGVVIKNNNLGPAGSCSDSQHIIYADHLSGAQIVGNWLFDDPYGFGVQLYESPANSTITGNVVDGTLDATVEASSQGGNNTSHNLAVNSVAVPVWNSFTGQFVDCYAGAGDTLTNNAYWNLPNGFGSCPKGVTVAGSVKLTANPFVNQTPLSDAYTLTAGAASQLSAYGLWDGQGPPVPNPALSYAPDAANTAVINGQAVPTGLIAPRRK